jgi:alpha-1,6-mannosyltransferase
MSARTLQADGAADARLPARRPAGLGAIAFVGFVGAVLLAWGAWRVAALPDRRARLEWIPDAPLLGGLPLPSRPLGYVLWGLGLAGLSLAWVLLRRRTVEPRHGVSLGAVAAIAGLWMLPLLFAPAMGSRDVYSYVAHGELAAQGVDPGTGEPADLGLTSPVYQGVDPVWRHVVSAYGPANTGLSEAAVRAAGHRVAGAVVLWRAITVAGVALIGLGVAVLARTSGRDPVDALVLAVAGPLTVVQLVGGPHNEALMAGLMACGLAVAARGKGRGAWVAGVALCALGAAVKVPALLGAVYLGWTAPGPSATVGRRIARTVLALVISLAVLEVLSLVTGAGWGWVGGLSAGADVTSLLSLSTTIGLTLAWVLQQPVSLGRVTSVVRDLFLAASVVIAGVLMWRTPRLGLVGLAGALAALAVLGPSVHAWYLTWALPPAAVVLAGRRVVWPLVVGIVAAASTRPMGGGLMRNLGYYSLPTLIGLLVVAVVAAGWFSLRSTRRTSRGRSADPIPASS